MKAEMAAQEYHKEEQNWMEFKYLRTLIEKMAK